MPEWSIVISGPKGSAQFDPDPQPVFREISSAGRTAPMIRTRSSLTDSPPSSRCRRSRGSRRARPTKSPRRD